MLKTLLPLATAAFLVSLPGAAAAQAGTQNRNAPAAHQQPKKAAEPNYGSWNNGWGARPPAPPRHWTRTGDWYRHVRACQQRYRSYNPRTDTYRANNGQNRRCTL
ncbi:MAG: BA14K family protein [Novosphingobium sp.]